MLQEGGTDQFTRLREEGNRVLNPTDAQLELLKFDARLGANIAYLLSQLLHFLLLDDKILPLEHLHLCLIFPILQHRENLAHLYVYGVLGLDKFACLPILLSDGVIGTGGTRC